jgi:phosphoribosylamine--glycine ligase
MKELLAVANVPTAAFGSFDVLDDALAMLRSMPAPYVIKTDGLAAGKGVLVTSSLAEAEGDLRDKMSGRSFGGAGARVVIEEALSGEECSLLVLVDGARAVPLIPAQDFKRVGSSDSGPNTGGMGALAPLPSMSSEMIDDVMRSVIEPALRELRRRGIDYRGVLYAGLMLTSGGPKLLEFNVRFGDPETEVIVPMCGDGLAEALLAAATGNLCSAPTFLSGAAVTVVLASRGYPLSESRGDLIDGLGVDGQLLDPIKDVVIFHAGTRQRDDQRFETAGGRVLAVTARASDIAMARERAYRAVSRVTFPGAVMRSDISARYAEGAG